MLRQFAHPSRSRKRSVWSQTGSVTPISSSGTPNLASMREDYLVGSFDGAVAHGDPFVQFERWLAEAIAQRERDEPTAMTLATADATGMPSARTVLLKGFDPSGFTWFTNYESRKGRELAANPNASLCFRWSVQQRQVIICGQVSRVADAESDEYFSSRPRGSRIGAIVSAQSTVIPNRSAIEERALELEQLPDHQLARPAWWGGFRLAPVSIEFWQGRPSRLHDRVRYLRTSIESTAWEIDRLSP